MVWTPREELERVPSFTEQQRRAQPTPPTDEDETVVEERVCDSCGDALDPVEDLHRTRHRSCPPPPIPADAQAVLDRLRARRDAP